MYIEMTNQKSKLTIQNIKMLLPLRNRCVGLKFLEFRHSLAYSNNCHCATHFFVIKIIKIVHFFLNCIRQENF